MVSGPFAYRDFWEMGPRLLKKYLRPPSWHDLHDDITMEFLEIACSQRFELRNKMLLYDEKLNNIALISSSDIVNKIMHTIW